MTATEATLQVIVSRVHSAPARLGPEPGPRAVRLVCIDGPAGSGKTTLAEQVALHTGGHLVHMDDLYEGWSGLLDVHTRVHRHILAPMAAGGCGRYQRYDWHTGAFTNWVHVPRHRLLILEGCGSGSRVVAPYVGLLIWVSAPDGLRLRRGLDRDGQQMEPQWRAFMADERLLYAREQTPERAHLHLDAWGDLSAPGGAGEAGAWR